MVEMRGSPLAPRKANRFVRVLPYSELRSAAKKAALWLFLNALGSTPLLSKEKGLKQVRFRPLLVAMRGATRQNNATVRRF